MDRELSRRLAGILPFAGVIVVVLLLSSTPTALATTPSDLVAEAGPGVEDLGYTLAVTSPQGVTCSGLWISPKQVSTCNHVVASWASSGPEQQPESGFPYTGYALNTTGWITAPATFNGPTGHWNWSSSTISTTVFCTDQPWLSTWSIERNGQLNYSCPTNVRMAYMDARPTMTGTILITFETAIEIDALGFDIYRVEVENPEDPVKINDAMIPSRAPGSLELYTYIDRTAVKGVTYYYWIVDVDLYGIETFNGPVGPVGIPDFHFVLSTMSFTRMPTGTLVWFDTTYEHDVGFVQLAEIRPHLGEFPIEQFVPQGELGGHYQTLYTKVLEPPNYFLLRVYDSAAIAHDVWTTPFYNWLPRISLSTD